MASSYETFKELDLTRDEVERLTDALKDKEFRKLFAEYVEEIKNPENQKIYQKEITELEKERGIDVTFINPDASYVIKTSINGSKKGFINICSNEHIKKPSSNPAVQEGTKGLKWSLPHSLTPPREDVDNKGDRCVVYDVVFHADTLHLAHKSKAFREMVNSTACDAIESSFDVTLDKKNLKFPKLQYKGLATAAVIRKPSKEKPVELSPEEQDIMDKLFESIEQPKGDFIQKSKKSPKVNVDDKSLYTTPQYVIKHRRSYEMSEFTEHQDAKMKIALPKELVVEINLPLLKSSADIVLDVAEKTLKLCSEKPAKYNLSLTLPYHVNQDSGNAKFDKDKKKLVITLPVKSRTFVLSDKDDSGVDTDYSSVESSPLEEVDDIMEVDNLNIENVCSKIEKFTFLDTKYHYSLPEFAAYNNEGERIMTFTVNIKNVDDASIKKTLNVSDFYIKFSSISSGFYSVHYALYVKLAGFLIDCDNVAVEIWDNNVTVQIPYELNCDTQKPISFLYGLYEDDLTEKKFEAPNDREVLPKTVQSAPLTDTDDYEPEVFIKPKMFRTKHKNKFLGASVETDSLRSTPIDIIGASESSSDEFSYSLSPGKGRGILKYIRNVRRTVSESGLDEVTWGSSIENSFKSVDSVIPEEGEISSSLKKTVRFNDVVSKKLYRSNSSILGQRKKNQRKAKAKKRAQERRHSESEVSETDDKKERDIETVDTLLVEKSNEDHCLTDFNFASDIFELDIN